MLRVDVPQREAVGPAATDGHLLSVASKHDAVPFGSRHRDGAADRCAARAVDQLDDAVCTIDCDERTVARGLDVLHESTTTAQRPYGPQRQGIVEREFAAE